MLVNGYNIGWNARGQYGFEYDERIYVISWAYEDTGGDTGIYVSYSSDQGENWTHVQVTTLVAISSFVGYFNVCVKDNLAYIGVVRAEYGPPTYSLTIEGLEIFKFNLDINSLIPYLPEDPGLMVNPGFGVIGRFGYNTFPPVPYTREIQIELYNNPAGDMGIMYSGPEDNYSGRVYYATFDGNSAGTGIELPGQTDGTYYYRPIGVTVDPDGNTYFFYGRSVMATTEPYTLLCVRMDIYGSFDTPVIVCENVYIDNTGGIISNPCIWPVKVGDVCVYKIAIVALTFTAGDNTLQLDLFTSDDEGQTWDREGLLDPWLDTFDVNRTNQPYWTRSGALLTSLALGFNQGNLFVAWTWSKGSYSTPDTGTYYAKLNNGVSFGDIITLGTVGNAEAQNIFVFPITVPGDGFGIVTSSFDHDEYTTRVDFFSQAITSIPSDLICPDDAEPGFYAWSFALNDALSLTDRARLRRSSGRTPAIPVPPYPNYPEYLPPGGPTYGENPPGEPAPLEETGCIGPVRSIGSFDACPVMWKAIPAGDIQDD